MFFSDPHLAYPVRLEKPNPVFARLFQQMWLESHLVVCLLQGHGSGPTILG